MAGAPSAQPPVEGPLGALLVTADSAPHTLTAQERAQVLDYSRQQADITRAAVDEAWAAAQAKGDGYVADADAGDYEAAVRAHGEHLSRAVAMTAQDLIEAAGADEASLTAEGVFSPDTDPNRREWKALSATNKHKIAWKEALAAEMPHRSFGNVAPNAEFGTAMTESAQKEFARSAAFYPDGMIRHADETGLVMRVRRTKARAHYIERRTFPVKTRVPVYAHPQAVIDAVANKTPSESTEDAVSRSLAWAGASYSVDGPSSWSGVVATDENRAALNEIVSTWENSPELRKRYGPKPEVTQVGQRLFVSTGNTESVPAGETEAAELTTDGSVGANVHELGHRMETSNRQIGAACRAFLARRTQGLEPTVYASSGSKVEMATKDSFVDHYVGKQYPSTRNNSEVFSVGMEAIASGRFGALSGQRRYPTADGFSAPDPHQPIDREHYALILGLLSTASADKD